MFLWMLASGEIFWRLLDLDLIRCSWSCSDVTTMNWCFLWNAGLFSGVLVVVEFLTSVWISLLDLLAECVFLLLKIRSRRFNCPDSFLMWILVWNFFVAELDRLKVFSTFWCDFDVNVLVLMQWKSIRLQFRFWCDVTCQPSCSFCDVGGWPVCFFWWFLTLFDVSNVVLTSSFARFDSFRWFRSPEVVLKFFWCCPNVQLDLMLLWTFLDLFSNFLRFWCWISDPALALKGTGG